MKIIKYSLCPKCKERYVVHGSICSKCIPQYKKQAAMNFEQAQTKFRDSRTVKKIRKALLLPWKIDNEGRHCLKCSGNYTILVTVRGGFGFDLRVYNGNGEIERSDSRAVSINQAKAWGACCVAKILECEVSDIVKKQNKKAKA